MSVSIFIISALITYYCINLCIVMYTFNSAIFKGIKVVYKGTKYIFIKTKNLFRFRCRSRNSINADTYSTPEEYIPLLDNSNGTQSYFV